MNNIKLHEESIEDINNLLYNLRSAIGEASRIKQNIEMINRPSFVKNINLFIPRHNPTIVKMTLLKEDVLEAIKNSKSLHENIIEVSFDVRADSYEILSRKDTDYTSKDFTVSARGIAEIFRNLPTMELKV